MKFVDKIRPRLAEVSLMKRWKGPLIEAKVLQRGIIVDVLPASDSLEVSGLE